MYDNLSYELFNSERPTFFSASDMQVLSTVFTAPLLPQDFSAVSSNNEIPLTIWISVAVRIRKRANTIGYLDTAYISQLNLPIFFVLSGYIYKLYSIYFLVINT